MLSDLRYAARLLARSPGFAAMSILTLALGVGANTAIFAVVHGVLFRALPFPEADRIAAVTRVTAETADDNHSAADYIDIKRESRSFEALAGYRMDVLDLSGGSGDPERVAGADVTPSFFDVFRVAPALGRAFSAVTDEGNGDRLVVLGHALWRRRFGGDPSVVGRSIRINRQPCLVLGVMPDSFRFPGDAQAWVMSARAVPTPPLAVGPDLLANREVHYFSAVARLKPGTTVAQATAELAAIAASLGERYPKTNGGQGFRAVPLQELLTAPARGGLFLLLGAVAVVLLIACANVAGLVLARATRRRYELALRSALGATRGRLVRQLLIESLLVGFLGGTVGLLLASWGLNGLVALVPDDFPRVHEIQVDPIVVAFSLALGAATAFLFGIIPALQLSGPDVTTALRGGVLRVGARRSSRTLSALVVLEVVSGVVLTVGAALLVKTLVRLEAVDPGYRTEGVITIGLPLPSTRYGTSEQQADFYTRVIEKLEANPVTRLSAAAFPLPLSSAAASGGVQVEGRPSVSDRERPVASITWASPRYFEVLGIALKRGRGINERDVRSAPRVAVISQRAAARFWPNEDPIGRRFSFGDETGNSWITVVGVVADVRHSALSSSPVPMVYLPLRQSALPLMSLVVRSDAGAGPVATALRSAVRQLDPELPVGEASDFSNMVARSLGAHRLRARLLAAFAAIALLLAAVGVYGVLSYRVSGRTREIGVRLALGAAPRAVFLGVLADGMKLALAGVAIGIVAALGLSRLIASQLFGVGPGDPLTLAGVACLLAAVALLACWLPARRVMRIDPVVALQAE